MTRSPRCCGPARTSSARSPRSIRAPEAAPLLAAAAVEGNATLHGTGIAPGGISEKFPLLLSAMSTGVTFVRAEEFSDMCTYGAPDVLRYVMGFGETPEKALSGPMQKMLDGGFVQAVKMIVDQVGFNADPKIRATQEIAVATAPIDSPMGTIVPGPGRRRGNSTGRPSSTANRSSG